MVNVGYSQEADENTTSEKSALIIQAGCVVIGFIGHVDVATCAIFHSKEPDLNALVYHRNTGTESNLTLEGNELPDIVQRLLKEAQERLCDLPAVDYCLVEPKPIPRSRDVNELYNQFPNFKSKLTERFYHYRFSC